MERHLEMSKMEGAALPSEQGIGAIGVNSDGEHTVVDAPCKTSALANASIRVTIVQVRFSRQVSGHLRRSAHEIIIRAER